MTAPSMMLPPTSQATSTQQSLNGSGQNLTEKDKLPSEKDQARLVSWVKENYEKMKTDRQRVRRTWDINLQMYAGEQYIQEMTGRSGITKIGTPPSPRHRERSITNRTRPLVMTNVTRMT